MNLGISDDDDASRHVTRDDFPDLSAVEWAAVERMGLTMGVLAIRAMLLGLKVDEQHAAVAKFMQNELDVARAQVASRHHQQQQANAAAGRPMHARRPETLKIDIAKFKAVEGESLMRWFVELEDAIESRHITDDAMKVMFGMSNLAGRAKAWALGLKLHDPYAFGSYNDFKTRLRQTFEPPRAEFRDQDELLNLRQGKRDLHAYAHHTLYLVSCIVAKPIDEQTQVAVFIKDLTDGPVKTHLFRLELDTLDQAILGAEHEDLSMKQAHMNSSSYHLSRRHETGCPEPMDLC